MSVYVRPFAVLMSALRGVRPAAGLLPALSSSAVSGALRMRYVWQARTVLTTSGVAPAPKLGAMGGCNGEAGKCSKAFTEPATAPRHLRSGSLRIPKGISSSQSHSIRVAIVTPRFFPQAGGIETHTFEVARRIAKRDHVDVTVLTTSSKGAGVVSEEVEGFRVVRCRAYPRRRDYYVAPALYKLIRDGGYDVVHCQGIHTAVPVIAMLAARRARIPYVITFHTGGHSSALRRMLRNIQWRVLGSLIRRASVLVAVSRFEEQLFRKLCGLEASNFRIVRNGGDLGASASVHPIRGRIISVGRLERYKGHQRVIKALPLIRLSIPEATLHIVGSGRYEARLRGLVRRMDLEKCVAIECISPRDRRGMAESVSGAAVLAALSDYESHPVAVMEALALGVPAVGLDVAGMSDLVVDGLVTGIPKGASSATVARILLLALNGGCTSRPGGLPTWDDAASDLADVYLEACGGSGNEPDGRGSLSSSAK
jgi:glycosyltransferase involved in cell wall biosynthesis